MPPVRADTVLVTVMHANNELGTVQPIEEIAIDRSRGRRFRFTPTACRVSARCRPRSMQLGVDFFSLSAHKIYGPKGAGALYVRRGLQLAKVQYGGSHERDRRPGTENVPGIVGLGAAAELAGSDREEENARVGRLRDRFERELLSAVPDAHVHALNSPRLPTTSSVRFDHCRVGTAADLSGPAGIRGLERISLLQRGGEAVSRAHCHRTQPRSGQIDAALLSGETD